MKEKFKYVLMAIAGILVIIVIIFGKVNPLKDIKDGNKEIKNEMSDAEKEQAITYANNFIRDNLSYLFGYFGKSYEDLNSMDNQNKLWLAYWLLKDDVNSKYLTDYTSDEILIEMQKLFGSNYTIIFEDINDYEGNPMYKYYESSKTYEYYGGGYGASVLELVRNDFVSIEKKDNKYYITYSPLFYYVDGFMDLGEINIIDINFNNITTYQINSYDEEIEISNEKYNKIKDKITKVTFIFERENDRFVLKGLTFNEQ